MVQLDWFAGMGDTYKRPAMTACSSVAAASSRLAFLPPNQLRLRSTGVVLLYDDLPVRLGRMAMTMQRKPEGPRAAASRLLAGFLAASLCVVGHVDMSHPAHLTLAAPPSAYASQLPDAAYARLAEVRGLLQNQKFSAADAILTSSLELWKKTDQPAVEIAAILKDRANARQSSDPGAALADLDAALALYAQLGDGEQPTDEVVGATFLRAQVHKRLADFEAAESDFAAALILDDENPFVWSARGEARLQRRPADYAGAARDFLRAETQFGLIGDKIRRTLAAADASLALYGSGEKSAALEKMAQVGRQARFDVASNDPENIPRLQEIARKEAELHLVRAGVMWRQGKAAEAAGYWARGCVRLEGYTMDAANREAQQQSKQEDAARRSLGGATTQDQADDLLAKMVGLSADSNYVKDRESDKPLWGQFVPGKATNFDPKAALPNHLDDFVGCKPFEDPNWVKKNRLWPPEVQDGVHAFVREYDLSQINDIKKTRQFKYSWDEMM